MRIAAASAPLISALPKGGCKETKHCLLVKARMLVTHFLSLMSYFQYGDRPETAACMVLRSEENCRKRIGACNMMHTIESGLPPDS